MEYYYLNEAGSTVGPLPEKALHGLKRAGVLADSTLVVLVGSENWHAYREVFSSSTKPSRTLQGTLTSRYGMLFAIAVALLVVVGVCIFLSRGAVTNGGKVHSPSNPDVAESDAVERKIVDGSSSEKIVDKKPQETPGSVPKEDVKVEKLADVSGTKVEDKASAGPTPQSNPLAEWYEFGYQQGLGSKMVSKAFGKEPVATKSGISQLMKNLGVDAAAIGTEQMSLCFLGYSDALSGKAMELKVAAEQMASILPENLQGYHRFRGGEEPAGDFASKARVATVLIFAQALQSGGSQGSGFFIAPGIILTNRHVIDEADRIFVRMPDNSVQPAELIKVSTVMDAALLKVKIVDHEILKLAQSKEVMNGAMVCAVGYPVADIMLQASGVRGEEAFKKLAPISTYGCIGGRQIIDSTKCFQVDLNINHGNSGGPVVGQDGRVVGISTYGVGANQGAQGLNFAVEIDVVREFIQTTVPTLKLD